MANTSFAQRQYTGLRGPKAPDWDKGIRCRLAVVWAKAVLLVCLLFVCMIPVLIIVGVSRRSIAFLVSVKRSTTRLVFTRHSPSELPATAPKVNETALDESGKPCDISQMLSHHAISRDGAISPLSPKSWAQPRRSTGCTSCGRCFSLGRRNSVTQSRALQSWPS